MMQTNGSNEIGFLFDLHIHRNSINFGAFLGSLHTPM
jgi:hypothetical protein